jgi:hypothetical protein
MKYCPYCAEPLAKMTDVCPHCNKAISPGVLHSLYDNQNSSRENRSARRKIWFKEHALFLIPLLTLIAGLIVGILVSYGYVQIEFAGEKESFQNQIAQLEAIIAQKDARVANTSEDFKKQLNQKNEIISVMQEELDIMGKVINFTIRLAGNSTVTPMNAEEADYYRRNVLYLQSQFNLQQDQLKEAGYENIQNYNLITVPQLVSE